MAVHTNCDKCGDEIKGLAHALTNAFNKTRYDLCDKCHEDFKIWISTVPAREDKLQIPAF